jgi:hypothetical protein
MAEIGGQCFAMEGKSLQSQYDHCLSCLDKFLRLYGKDTRFEVQLNPAFQAVADKLNRQGLHAITSSKVQPALHFYIAEALP